MGRRAGGERGQVGKGWEGRPRGALYATQMASVSAPNEMEAIEESRAEYWPDRACFNFSVSGFYVENRQSSTRAEKEKNPEIFMTFFFLQ